MNQKNMNKVPVSLFKAKNQKYPGGYISRGNKNFTKNLASTRSPGSTKGTSGRVSPGREQRGDGKQIRSNQINLSQSPIKDPNTRLIIHIKATFNNTLLTLTNFKGQVLIWASAGSCGFKGARKGTPFAAQKVVEIFIKKSNDYLGRCNQIKIYVCGVGPGRENAIRGLGRSLNEAIQPKQKKRINKAMYKPSNKITLIREMTKIPHNGCRPAKKRRL